MNPATKKCPLCAEQIPLEATVCEYCGVKFEVTTRSGKIESNFSEEPATVAPLPSPPPVIPQAGKKSRLSWILGSLLALLVVGSVMTILLLRSRGTPLPTLPFPVTPTSASRPPTTTPNPSPISISLAWKQLSAGSEFARDTITVIVMAPQNQDVIYVGTTNIGIYKSTDGGNSWQPSSNGLESASIHELIIDPVDSQTLYAGVRSSGIYKTTNGGQTWQMLNTGAETGDEHFILLDPNDNQHLYDATSQWIYETRDGGITWSQVKTTDCPGQVQWGGFAIQPTNGDELLYTQWETSGDCKSGVYRSADGGRTWFLIGLEGMRWLGLVTFGRDINEQDVYFAQSWDTGNLYATYNRGQRWHVMLKNAVSNALFVTSYSPTTIYYGGSGLGISTDGGFSWTRMAVPLEPVEAIYSQRKHEILIGGAGLFMTTNDGRTWVERNSGLGSQRLELKLDPQDDNKIFVAEFAGCRLYQSNDRGKTWSTLVERARWCGPSFDSTGTVMYIVNFDFIISRSLDGGISWESITTPVEDANRNGRVMANPHIPDNIFYFYQDSDVIGSSIYYSLDSGKTWEASTGPIGQIFEPGMFFDTQGQFIYIIANPSYRSEDGGKTWKRCSDQYYNLPTADSRAAISPTDGNRLYVATRGRGILLSTDGCETVQEINTGLGSLFVNSVAIDPNNPDTIYAGTDGGAYISFDGGESWGQVNDGLLGATVVYSIVVDSGSNVYAATPFGIFQLEKR